MRKGNRFVDKAGTSCETWEVVEFAGKNKRGRYQYRIKCKNCGLERLKPSYEVNKNTICTICKGLSRGQAGLNEVFTRYKNHSNGVGREFTLTVEQVKTITSSNCHYCGRPPHNVLQHRRSDDAWGNYSFNGIDRKDNNLGYCLGNCLPCCEACNRAKNDVSYDAFINYLNTVTKFRVEMAY